jgi:hypothetical protein
VPFDGTITDKPAQPDAAFLSRVLREGSEGVHWPEGFVWDFCDADCCGIGMGRLLWANFPDNGDDHSHDLAEAFALPEPVAFRVFCSIAGKPAQWQGDVIPLHVAEAIDAALAARTPVAVEG